MGPDTAPGGRVPPMLDVAFAELTRGSAEQMLAGQRRFGMHQRHDVLQLVTESESAAGLIKPRPTPETAAQCLVNEPAVRHHIDGGIGRVHIDCAESSIPIIADTFERHAAGVWPAEAPDQILHIGRVAANPETKTRFPL